MRVAVREEIKYGSEWIKLLVSGAFMSSGDNPNCVHFSDEELEMALAEATRLVCPLFTTPLLLHASSPRRGWYLFTLTFVHHSD